MKRTNALPHDNISEENSLLSHDEWDVYSLLSNAWNLFIQLPQYHIVDTKDFADGINLLKNIVMARPVSREIAGQNVGGYSIPESEKSLDEEDTVEMKKYEVKTILLNNPE